MDTFEEIPHPPTTPLPDIASAEELLDAVGWLPFTYRGLRDSSAQIDPESVLVRQTLELAIAERRAHEFERLFVMCAMAGKMPGFWVLADGASLFPHCEIIFHSFLKMEGDPHEPFYEALKSGRLDPDTEVMLFELVWFWRIENKVETGADELRTAQRRAAIRFKKDSTTSPLVLLVMAIVSQLSDDPELLRLIGSTKPIPEGSLKSTSTKGLRKAKAPIQWSKLLPAHEAISDTGTVRRIAPRLGRNDPCHCGSGLKYKKCCSNKSESKPPVYQVDGFPLELSEKEPERKLTVTSVQQFSVPDLFQVNPSKVEPDVFAEVVKRLAHFKENTQVRKMIEFLGPENIDPMLWEDLLYEFLFSRDVDAIRWVLPFCDSNTIVPIEAQVLAAEPQAALAIVLEHLREAFQFQRKATKDEPSLSMLDVARCCNMIDPALGLLVARGVAIGAASDLAPIFSELRNMIERARIDLGLAGVDPALEWVNDELDSSERERKLETEIRKERLKAEERVARRQLEVVTLRKKLAVLQKELDHSEREEKTRQKQTAKSADNIELSQESLTRLEELREKTRMLKNNLKLEHEEHARDRDALHAARLELRRLEESAAAAGSVGNTAEPDDPAENEECLLGESVEPEQAVRLPEFADSFRGALKNFDARITANAVALTGRLSAGDPHAWRGVRKLKMRPDFLRQKVGRQHRMIFRSKSDALEFVALIDRRDLESWLRRGC